MRKLFYLMGKSASGKDTLYRMLLSDPSLALSPFVIYTTRPMRDHEKEGREYHFTDEEGKNSFLRAGKVIELRTYSTVKGPWHYFTVDDGAMEAGEGGRVPVTPNERNLLGIGTPESYVKIRDHYGPERVIPLYVDVPDELRRERALEREMQQEVPQLAEMERRFAADEIDFSPEKLKAAGITQAYDNSGPAEATLEELKKVIKERG